MKSYFSHFLTETIHLLLYAMVGVSVLSILLPKLGIEFHYATWGNLGGFSLACDIIFLDRFTFNKRYCWLTRALPIAMIIVNILNILCNIFLEKHYELYGSLYEISVFSLTLFISLILSVEKILRK